MKRSLLVLSLLAFLFCSQALANAADHQNYSPKFEYDAPARPTDLQEPVVFALVNVICKTNNQFNLFASEQLAGLPRSINRDMGEIVIARGSENKGSYTSADLMPFPDKKAIDMIIIPSLQLSFSVKDLTQKGCGTFFEPATCQMGKVVVSGNITVEMREPVSGELMWIQTTPLDFESAFSYKMNDYADSYTPGVLLSHEPVLDVVARELELRYPDIMANFYALIDPEEMTQLRDLAREIKTHH